MFVSRQSTSSQSQSLRRARGFKPSVEILEDRWAPAVITVTGLGDNVAADGVVTLREAITSIDQGANVNADVAAAGAYGVNDQINFNLPGAGAQSIYPISALPSILKPVFINGYSQPGASFNSSTTGDNAVVNVVLNGAFAGPSINGLFVNADGCGIEGLNIRNFDNDGILVFGSNNQFIGNYIGTDATGTSIAKNGNNGIDLHGGSGNVVGLSAPLGRNLISGNGHDGIFVHGPNNTIKGNLIGTDASSTVKLGNGSAGVEVENAADNTIGGPLPGAGNVIGGNLGAGVKMDNASSTIVQGNSIGISSFSTDVGNADTGITITGMSANILIGGTTPDAPNRIAFNTAPNGNSGGIVAFGSDVHSTFSDNSIFANNKPDIVVEGANNEQNAPVLTGASLDTSTTTITGTFHSSPKASYRLEFFSTPSANGAPQVFRGSVQVFTDGNGDAPVVFAANALLLDGTIVATATDAQGNTSAFSAALAPLPPSFAYDLAAKTLSIVATNFLFAQATTADAQGTHTVNTFTADGAVAQLADALLTEVIVAGPSIHNTATLITNDTYLGADNLTHETPEIVALGPGGGYLDKLDAANKPVNFLQLTNFDTSYAYVGRADTASLIGVKGNGIENVFVSAGNYGYTFGSGQFHLISGAANLYGYSLNSTDQAWHYDALGGLDSFVSSGNAYSYMSGKDANGQSFFNEAIGFGVNYGIATHGNAIAYLIDSPGNDTFDGNTSVSYLSGPGCFNCAEAFALVYGQSFVGGVDYSYNYDPSHNILGGKWNKLV